MPSYMWILIAVAFAFAEMLTMGLTSIWFSGGALAAFLAACLGGSQILQVVIFLAVSTILVALTRPLSRRLLRRKTVKTNADSLIGRCGVVTEPISNRLAEGQVQVNGAVWSARSQDGGEIGKDTSVRVLAIEGVKLIVEPAGRSDQETKEQAAKESNA